MKYFKNITSTSADFYVYGGIVDEKDEFWDGELAIDPNEMKKELDELQGKGISDFNIYINSPGGSVFASSTIVSMLKRFKQSTGAKIHSFIDGLCASAATYLLMVADDINVYQNSMMMIHKPMTVSWGNVDDLQKDIDTLNTIENDMMIPMYMNKAKIEENELKDLIANETWFNGNEKDDMFIGNFFNINYLDSAKQVTACVSKDLFKNYKNIPDTLKKMCNENKEPEVKETEGEVQEEPKVEEVPKQQEIVDKKQKLDYSAFDNILSSLKK